MKKPKRLKLQYSQKSPILKEVEEISATLVKLPKKLKLLKKTWNFRFPGAYQTRRGYASAGLAG